MESNSKEIRLGIAKIDRISELPDPILSIVLSYLPTKNAVGTSILSTRWNNLFPFEVMPKKLDLDDSLLLNPNRGENNNSDNTPRVYFMDFVDKLLNVTLSDANSVEEIILHCNKQYGVKKVASWICATVRLNVRRLDLKFASNKSMALFHSLNGCATLVTLRLWFESECCPPDNFNLPNLKTLYLAKLIFNDDDEGEPINQLLLGCPTLEYLHLFQCNLKNLYDVSIKCPVLKKLAIENCWEQFLGHLTIDAPNLEVLIYDGFLATFYDVCDFSSLHTARMGIRPSRRLLNLAGENHDGDDLWWGFNNSTTMFVSRCSSTIRLYLSDRAIDGLHRSSLQLPIFHNLMWLSLGCLHWSILARLLQIAPNLEYLIIEEVRHSLSHSWYKVNANFHSTCDDTPNEITMVLQDNEEGFQNFRHLLPIPPECLLLHVKSFEFHMFEGDEDDIKLVEYFLKNGEVLQNLILHCLPSVDMHILARLRMLPRQSTTCQIDCKILHEMNI